MVKCKDAGMQGRMLDFAPASSHRTLNLQNKHHPDRKVDPSEHFQLHMHLWCTLPLNLGYFKHMIAGH